MIYTPYSEEDISKILWGTKEAHPLLFFENPSVREPILTVFGRLYPWNTLNNPNVSINTWRKLFNYALGVSPPCSLENIRIPTIEKLIVGMDIGTMRRINTARRTYGAPEFTEENWSKMIFILKETDTNATSHTHPDILRACNEVDVFLQTVNIDRNHIFFYKLGIQKILKEAWSA
jgi:hypothetical protein